MPGLRDNDPMLTIVEVSVASTSSSLTGMSGMLNLKCEIGEVKVEESEQK